MFNVLKSVSLFDSKQEKNIYICSKEDDDQIKQTLYFTFSLYLICSLF